jgi:hypothetical protein
MNDSIWRPLGVEDDEGALAEYDALHDGVPAWMTEAYWAWVRESLTVPVTSYMGTRVEALHTPMAESMCQALRIPFPNLRADDFDYNTADSQFKQAMPPLRAHHSPLQIADFLLAAGGRGDEDALSRLLDRSNSAWMVGTRDGHSGLQRRVPIRVQKAVDSTIGRSGRAGVRLAKAWEHIYGMAGSSSEAYRLAIQAVEDAAIPVVSPTNIRATLGTVIAQIEAQKDWTLPIQREATQVPAIDIVTKMMRLLWYGQHDRHGGQPSAPGAVTREEAQVAVSTAVLLVDWFTQGAVQRHAS